MQPFRQPPRTNQQPTTSKRLERPTATPTSTANGQDQDAQQPQGGDKLPWWVASRGTVQCIEAVSIENIEETFLNDKIEED